MKNKQVEKVRKALKKAWWFVWESNSIWSWIVNIILAFLIIKFLVYPGLGFALGTTHPVVAVISGSMEHQGSFDEWWAWDSCCTSVSCSEKISQEELYIPYLITKTDFKNFKFKNGFNKGDIMILKNTNNIEIGDTIIFKVANRGDPIIHRVVDIQNENYFTKGDNNCGSADFEKKISKNQILGEASVRVPLLGWIKIGFVNLLSFFRIGG